jgi:hypothetical protein
MMSMGAHTITMRMGMVVGMAPLGTARLATGVVGMAVAVMGSITDSEQIIYDSPWSHG